MHFPRGSAPSIALSFPRMKLDEKGDPTSALDHEELLEAYDIRSNPASEIPGQDTDVDSGTELETATQKNAFKW